MNTQLEYAIQELRHERAGQDRLWGTQNHSPAEWMLILMEEVGEFSQAVLDSRHVVPAKHIKKELIQVAAVALAMLECCNRNNWGKDK